VLEVIEERADQRRVEIIDVQRRRLAPGALDGERDQQLERVAVGSDRVWADMALTDQPVAEERLQRRRERAHPASPRR
jgi:hypothetical protein